MKRCPTCQQTYPDTAPDICPNDGTQLYSDAGQWQQAPPQGGYYPPPPGQYGPPPGQYPPPYGAAAPGGGAGLSKAALFTGIAAAGALALGFALILIGANNFDISMIQIGAIIFLLSLVAGIGAVVLGIIVLVMSGKNPAMSKAHGIIGLVLGALPIILWIVGLANQSSYRYR